MLFANSNKSLLCLVKWNQISYSPLAVPSLKLVCGSSGGSLKVSYQFKLKNWLVLPKV